MPSVLENDALAMYVAAATALIVMIGFFWYLWSLDRAVAEMRRKLDERGTTAPQKALTPVRPHRRMEQEQGHGNTGG